MPKIDIIIEFYYLSVELYISIYVIGYNLPLWDSFSVIYGYMGRFVFMKGMDKMFGRFE